MSNKTKNTSTGKVFDTQLLSRLLSYTRPYRKLFFLGTLLTICISLLTPVRPVVYGWIIDTFVVKDGAWYHKGSAMDWIFEHIGHFSDAYFVRIFILFTLVILLIETLLGYANTLLTNWLGQSVVRDLRNQVFEHILHLRMGYYDQNPLGNCKPVPLATLKPSILFFARV